MDGRVKGTSLWDAVLGKNDESVRGHSQPQGQLQKTKERQ